MIRRLLEKLNIFKKKEVKIISWIYVKNIDKYYVIFEDGVVWNIPYDRYPEWKKKAVRNLAIVLEDVLDETDE